MLKHKFKVHCYKKVLKNHFNLIICDFLEIDTELPDIYLQVDNQKLKIPSNSY